MSRQMTRKDLLVGYAAATVRLMVDLEANRAKLDVLARQNLPE